MSVASAACGLAKLEGRRSQACRCSRARRPSGSDSELRDRLGVPPQRHPSEVGDPLTRTPLRRACRRQRPSSPLIAHAHRGPTPPDARYHRPPPCMVACTGSARLRRPPWHMDSRATATATASVGEHPMSAGPRNRIARGLWLLTAARTSARDRSRVEHEPVLRPGFSAQARMPPTALPAPRGERPGLLVLTAGPALLRRHPTGPVTAPLSDRPLGGSRPLPSRADPPEGRKGVRP